MTEPIVHLPKNYDRPVTVTKKSHRINTRLSVVVPMYNVALFLREALDSLLRQGVNEVMQVILIDDGSKDESSEIAKEYVEQYPDIFELYIFENGGLGAARNRGTNLAEGEYITYVDPDDIVVDESYEKMLKMISRTDSDVIGGAVRRFNSTGKQWTSTVHDKTYHDRYEATTLESHPELIWDTTAWNKIYRLDFIRQYSLYFPEKMLYEDMPMVVPMYALARTVDVFDEVMYLWRERDEGAPSITQATAQKNNFTDRVKGMKMILRSLVDYGAPQNAQDEQLNKMLNFDLRLPFTYEKYLALDDDYKDTIFEQVKEFLQLLTPEQFNQAHFWYRALYIVWLNQPKFEVQKAITTFAKYAFHVSFNKKTGNFHSSYQDEFDFQLPTFDGDFEAFTRLHNITEENKEIVLDGHLFYRYMDLPSREMISNIKIDLVDKNGDILIHSNGTADMLYDPDATAKWGFDNTQNKWEIPAHNFDISQYRITLPLSELSQLDQTAYVKLKLTVYNRQLEIIISEPMPGDDPRPEGFVIDDGYLMTSYSSDWRLRLNYVKHAPLVTKTAWVKNNYLWTIVNAKKHVIIWNPLNKEIRELVQSGNQYTISRRDIKYIGTPGSQGQVWWQFMTTDSIEDTDKFEAVRMATPIIAEPHTLYKNMSVFHVSNSITTLAVSWQYPLISDITLNDSSATIKFSLDGWANSAISAAITFEQESLDIRYKAKKIQGLIFNRSVWEVTIPLEYGLYGQNALIHPEVTLTFLHRKSFTMPLRWGKSKFDVFRQENVIGQLTWYFGSDDKEEHRVLTIRQRNNRQGFSTIGEKVSFWQGQYQEWLKEPILEKTIMYSSYWGKDFNDNPRALYEYIEKNHPGYQHIAVYSSLLQDVKLPGVKPVITGTKEYWYYMARAKYFVNNVNFEGRERFKRSEQVEIQTMHGTPLKQMGFNVLQDWSSASYEQYLAKNRNWDYLTVPSDYVAEIASDAYRHEAQVLKTGYSRNDELFIRNNESEILRIKQAMTLPVDKKILLYAPTWRKKGETKLGIDFKNMYANLRDDQFVLVRAHHLSGHIDVPAEFSDKIILSDNSFTIEDYYLISDVLITDYSSVMFDYALLNKPMIFFTYDFENYVSSRGLNFDFKNDAPGPLVYTQQELNEVLKNFEEISENFDNKIKQFNKKFIQYDTGHASEGVFNEVFATD